MSKYLYPFGTNNQQNLDSLRTPPTPVLGTGARWGSHIELTVDHESSFRGDSWVPLSKSGTVLRYLACGEDGSTLRVQKSLGLDSYLVASGAIVLCTPVGTGWRVSIPRNDCLTTIVNDTDGNQLVGNGVRK
jgi:hypothetical protein